MKKLILLLVLVLFSTSNIYAQKVVDESFEFIKVKEFNKLLPEPLKEELKPGEMFLCDYNKKIVKLSKEDVEKYVKLKKTYTKYKFKNKKETSIKYDVEYKKDAYVYYTVGETIIVSSYNNQKTVLKNQYDYFGQEIGPEILSYEHENSIHILKEEQAAKICNYGSYIEEKYDDESHIDESYIDE